MSITTAMLLLVQYKHTLLQNHAYAAHSKFLTPQSSTQAAHNPKLQNHTSTHLNSTPTIYNAGGTPKKKPVDVIALGNAATLLARVMLIQELIVFSTHAIYIDIYIHIYYIHVSMHFRTNSSLQSTKIRNKIKSTIRMRSFRCAALCV